MNADVYSAVVLTVLTLAVVLALGAVLVVTRPRVGVTGRHVDEYPGMVTDPADTGVRVTEIAVVSPFPLAWMDARYRLSLPDAELVLDHATHAQVVEALRQAGVDDATWSVTFMVPGGVLSPSDWPVFALTLPLVRRLAVLEATVTLRDPLGRTVTKTIPALPKQPLGRPVTAAERAGARA